MSSVTPDILPKSSFTKIIPLSVIHSCADENPLLKKVTNE